MTSLDTRAYTHLSSSRSQNEEVAQGIVKTKRMLTSFSACEAAAGFYLAGERQRGGHFLHGQVPDARGEGASARRTAA